MGFFSRFGWFDFFRAKKNYMVQRKVSFPSGQKKGWTDYYNKHRGSPAWGRKIHALLMTASEARDVIKNAKGSTQGHSYSYKLIRKV